MSRIVFFYNKAELTRINPAFANIRPDYQQRVEAIFTDDKNDPLWNGKVKNVAGTALEASVRDKTKFLHGTIVMDLSIQLREEGGSLTAGSSVLSFNKPSLEKIKERIFNTLAHELLHILQGWVWGESWDNRYQEARQETLSRDFLNEILMTIKGEQSYYGYKNRYELAAFAFGNDWITNNRQKLKAGFYDDLIPISHIKTLLSKI